MPRTGNVGGIEVNDGKQWQYWGVITRNGMPKKKTEILIHNIWNERHYSILLHWRWLCFGILQRQNVDDQSCRISMKFVDLTELARSRRTSLKKTPEVYSLFSSNDCNRRSSFIVWNHLSLSLIRKAWDARSDFTVLLDTHLIFTSTTPHGIRCIKPHAL